MIRIIRKISNLVAKKLSIKKLPIKILPIKILPIKITLVKITPIKILSIIISLYSISASSFEISPAYKLARNLTDRITPSNGRIYRYVDQKQVVDIRNIALYTIHNTSPPSTNPTYGPGGDTALSSTMYYNNGAFARLNVPTSVLLASLRQSVYNSASANWSDNAIDAWNTYLSNMKSENYYYRTNGLLLTGKLTSAAPTGPALRVQVDTVRQQIISIDGLYFNGVSLVDSVSSPPASVTSSFLSQGNAVQGSVLNFTGAYETFASKLPSPSDVYSVAKGTAATPTQYAIRSDNGYFIGPNNERDYISGLYADACFVNNYYGTKMNSNFKYCVFGFYTGDTSTKVYHKAGDNLSGVENWKLKLTFYSNLDDAKTAATNGLTLGSTTATLNNGLFIGELPNVKANEYSPILNSRTNSNEYRCVFNPSLTQAAFTSYNGGKVLDVPFNNNALYRFGPLNSDGTFNLSTDASRWLEVMNREYLMNAKQPGDPLGTNSNQIPAPIVITPPPPQPTGVLTSDIASAITGTLSSTMYYYSPVATNRPIDVPTSVLTYGVKQTPADKTNALDTWKLYTNLQKSRNASWLTAGQTLSSTAPTGANRAYLRLTVNTSTNEITDITGAFVRNNTGATLSQLTTSNRYGQQTAMISGGTLAWSGNGTSIGTNPLYSTNVFGYSIDSNSYATRSDTAYKITPTNTPGLFSDLSFTAKQFNMTSSQAYPYCAFMVYRNNANVYGRAGDSSFNTTWNLQAKFFTTQTAAASATFTLGTSTVVVGNGVWLGKVPTTYSPLMSDGNTTPQYRCMLDPLLAVQTNYTPTVLTLSFNGGSTYTFGALQSNKFNTATGIARWLEILVKNYNSAHGTSQSFGDTVNNYP